MNYQILAPRYERPIITRNSELKERVTWNLFYAHGLMVQSGVLAEHCLFLLWVEFFASRCTCTVLIHGPPPDVPAKNSEVKKNNRKPKFNKKKNTKPKLQPTATPSKMQCQVWRGGVQKLRRSEVQEP